MVNRKRFPITLDLSWFTRPRQDSSEALPFATCSTNGLASRIAVRFPCLQAGFRIFPRPAADKAYHHGLLNSSKLADVPIAGLSAFSRFPRNNWPPRELNFGGGFPCPRQEALSEPSSPNHPRGLPQVSCPPYGFRFTETPHRPDFRNKIRRPITSSDASLFSGLAALAARGLPPASSRVQMPLQRFRDPCEPRSPLEQQILLLLTPFASTFFQFFRYKVSNLNNF